MSKSDILPKTTWQVDVLGTTYTITAVSETEDKELSKCAGYTDAFLKEIVVDNYTKFNELYPDRTLTKDVPNLIRSTMRHEIVHAFMVESGITKSSTEIKWAHDESLIEWISTMLPKMIVAMERVSAINEAVPCPKN